MDKYKIYVDRKEIFVNTPFLTGKQIKLVAGITSRDEELAEATYGNEEMGWFVYKIIVGNEKDEQILDNDYVDLHDERHSKFYTACNGTYILGENKNNIDKL